MRRYLKEFLSDRRVFEVNRALWWFILNGKILTFRPQKSGRAYEKIWNTVLDESPLKTITRGQSEKLREALKERPEIVIDWAMAHGLPAVNAASMLKEQGCDRNLFVRLSGVQCGDHGNGQDKRSEAGRPCAGSPNWQRRPISISLPILRHWQKA